MNRKKRIENILKKKLLHFSIRIIDNSHFHKGHNNFNGQNETHLLIKIKKLNNVNINKLETHRLINNLLKNEFDNGLHALEIQII